MKSRSRAAISVKRSDREWGPFPVPPRQGGSLVLLTKRSWLRKIYATAYTMRTNFIYASHRRDAWLLVMLLHLL